MLEAIRCGKFESVKFYNAWVTHVKKTVPPNRLLVFEVTQRWEPLCNFLKLPVPEGPFPRVNDSSEILWNFKKLQIMAYVTLWGTPIFLAIISWYTLIGGC